MRKVLIVVDMQNDFVTGSLGTPEAQAIVPRVVEKVKEFADKDYEIIFTRDVHYSNYLEGTLEGKYLPIEHCIDATPGYYVIPELDELHMLYSKDAFKSTFGYNDWYYKLQLRKRQTSLLNYNHIQFEIVGLCTDICVISNALILRTEFPNSEIIVHADCCAGTTPEKHAAALEVMKSCQILIKGE